MIHRHKIFMDAEMKYNNIVNITLKSSNKKLLKSSTVKKYLKMVSRKINRQLQEEKFEDKLSEAIAMNYPLMLYKDGRIKVIRDFQTP